MILESSNLRILAITAFLIIAIYVRMEAENEAMNKPALKEVISIGASYETKLEVKSDPSSSNFQVSFVAIDSKLDHRVLALSSGETSNILLGLKVGDRINAKGYLSELSGYQKYRNREHLVAVFKVLDVTEIRNSNNALDISTQALRDTIEKGCSPLKADERGVCEGLLIGKRNSISNDLYSTYRQAQLTHLLVASGANIAFLIGFLNPIISRFGKRFSSLTLVVVALFYCVATRFEPSILRASVMVILPTLLSLNGYVVSKTKVFIFTLLVCSLIDPFLIYRVGFWLSLCATGGLFFLAPRMEKIVKSEIVRNTIAATICVQPVLWGVFGFQVPVRWWASVIAVAIAEPLTTIGMVLVSSLAFVNPNSIVSKLGMLPMDLGCRAVNLVAKLGASSQGYLIGWAITAIMLFAYTVKGIRKVRNSSKANQFYGRINGLLHNRR